MTKEEHLQHLGASLTLSSDARVLFALSEAGEDAFTLHAAPDLAVVMRLKVDDAGRLTHMWRRHVAVTHAQHMRRHTRK